MHRALFVLLLTIPATAQNPSPDTQLTQALLAEIRALRQDLQTTAATIQRVQIVMYRLQAESALMSRATQRLDDARGRCNQAQAQIRMATDEIQRSEERLRNANDAAARSLAEVSVARIKSQLQMFTADEQQCRVREAEADSQFRTERARMSELEDQLDKLDRILGTIGK